MNIFVEDSNHKSIMLYIMMSSVAFSPVKTDRLNLLHTMCWLFVLYTGLT